MVNELRLAAPWVRVVAISRASPAPASHAEKASRSIGVAIKRVVLVSNDQIARRRNKDNISPSRHSKTDKIWLR